MSSEISIDRTAKAGSRGSRAGHHDGHDALQPWQLFTLAGLAGATAVVFATRESGPAGVILLSITVGAAAWMGLAAWRTLAALFGLHVTATTEVLGGRTRAALERDKVLVLRAIRDLEFDRAMGKVSEKDFAEMNTRLRNRAAGILKQLDRGAGYRDEIEHELQKRLGPAGLKASDYAAPPGAPALTARDGSTPVAPGLTMRDGSRPVAAAVPSDGYTCTCGTLNDIDARFCKTCGSRLEAA
jgi:hypothetical protein